MFIWLKYLASRKTVLCWLFGGAFYKGTIIHCFKVLLFSFSLHCVRQTEKTQFYYVPPLEVAFYGCSVVHSTAVFLTQYAEKFSAVR